MPEKVSSKVSKSHPEQTDATGLVGSDPGVTESKKKSVKKKNFSHLIQESGTVIRATCAASPKSLSSTSFYHGLNWLERKCQARVPFGSKDPA